jgi:putative SOS response-associated peptidase YedK
MCYNVKALLQSQLKRARLKGIYEDIEAIQKELLSMEVKNLYQVSGFSHPKLLIYQDQISDPVPAIWGLIPHWVKDNDQRVKLWNNTLNARGESIFEKPSFRDSANSKRCLLYLDGFYEHHHYKGKTYPFFINKKDNEPFPVAGLWSEWQDRENKVKMITFSIVTTKGNEMMAKIHNNPKLEGPRMPVILPDELADEWLDPSRNQNELNDLLLPFPDDLLKAHTVYRISGKESKGNVPEAENEYQYEELEFSIQNNSTQSNLLF